MRLPSSPLIGGCLIALLASAQAQYQTVHLPYSKDSIRVKEFVNRTLCSGGGKHYTGWADIGERHLFYWYHPSRSKASKAPLLIWLQGGPGGSSIIGMLAENGPCLMDKEANSTHFNPESWTESFNVIYLDQPAGVGFSYIDDSENLDKYPRRTEESALDFVVAIKLFQAAFEELSSVPLHIAGESYAGRYIPEYGAAVLDYNRQVLKEQRIPLVSLMVGNGITSPRQQYPALYETGCFTQHEIPPIFNETQCSSMAAIVDRCEMLFDLCDEFQDEIVCNAAGGHCQALQDIINESLVNRYDRTVVCPGVGDCYPLIDHIIEWLNTEDVMNQLEISQESGGRKKTFQIESEIIRKRYFDSADYFTSTVPALRKVLQDPSVDVLYYVGVQDWICNALGIGRMLDSVQWKGHAQFRGEKMTPLPWQTKTGSLAGYMRKVEGLWLVELYGAGHLVPYDQPASALHLVQAWLKEIESKTSRFSPDRQRTPLERVDQIPMKNMPVR